MFCILVTLRVKDAADVDRVANWLGEAAELSRGEPGCERFEVYHSRGDRQVFVLCEWWSTEAVWQAHRDERAFREIYAPNVLPLVERSPHPCDLLSPPPAG